MLSVIIAAGALFTAVYNVIYRYNTTNTTILNAATDMTGKVSFKVAGSGNQCNETTTLRFDEGTWMVIFAGQDGGAGGLASGWTAGEGAVCLAFFKGSQMTVSIGVGGGKGGGRNSSAPDGSGNANGGGKTIVATNFARPFGQESETTAIASGAGGGTTENYTDYYSNGVVDQWKVMDGTFKGWEPDAWSNDGSTNWSNTLRKMHGETRVGTGTPGTWAHGGIGTYSYVLTCNAQWDGGYWPRGGGAGYYDGGAGRYGVDQGAGGSCSPSCYPIGTSDIQNNQSAYHGLNGSHWGAVGLHEDFGSVYLYRMDGDYECSVSNVTYNKGVARLSISEEFKTPYEIYQGHHPGLNGYDCGIRVGWVYSCSEDGEKWGACSDSEWSKA